MSRRLLALALVSGLSGACHQTATIVRKDPGSFRVHITCAGTGVGSGLGECPPVPTGALTCPTMPQAPNLGTPIQPVDRSQNYYELQIQALDHNGNPYAAYNRSANVYIMFEGSVTPPRIAATCQTDPAKFTAATDCLSVPVTNGQACLGLTIPPAFNQTALWVEDPPIYSDDPTRPGARMVTGSSAIGASEPIYRPSPLVTDVAYTDDPVQQLPTLNNKHVIVNNGTNGAPIVVTYVASNYFTATDLGTADNDYRWGSIELYTYQLPYATQVGSVLTNVNGQLSDFLGLPELNFPVWEVVDNKPELAASIQPHIIEYTDLGDTLGKMAPHKSGVVEVKSTDPNNPWIICPLTSNPSLKASYLKYQEWVIATPTSDCTNWMESMDVVSDQGIPGFDPEAHPLAVICSLKGILSVVVPIGGVNLWTITPRSPSDLVWADKFADCPQ